MMSGARVTCTGAVILFLMPGALGWTAEAPEPSNTSSPFRYDAKERRDPFVPLVRNGQLLDAPAGTHASLTAPVLYGIFWDPDGASIALINDAEAKVGDMIGEYKVVQIRQDAVVLSNGGEPLVLEIAFDGRPSPNTTTGGERR